MARHDGEVAPYGMLIYPTREQRALVVPATGVAKLETTPARPPFAVVNTMNAEGTLDADGKSTSRLTFTFRGDDEISVRAVLRQLSPAQYDQLAQQLCASLGYQGTASHMEVSRVDDTSEPLKMSFDYKREKAGDWPNYRTIPQLAPVNLIRPDEKDPPVQELTLGVPRVEISHSAMKLPQGWGVEFPEAVHQKSPYATYDETYRFDQGTMYAERRIEVLKERVPVSDWKTYSRFAEKATFPPYDSMGVKTEPATAQKELIARADALRKQGAHSATTDARAALQKLRIHPLGPAAGLNGVAEYKMLVSGDSVVRVELSGEQHLAGGEQRLMKAKLAGLIPPGAQAQVVLLGMLNCHSGVCEFVLEP